MFRRVKPACTIGPASCYEEVIREVIKLGCRIFRINFSHGDERMWSEWVSIVRDLASESGVEVVLIGDLRGRSIRLGYLDKETSIKEGDVIQLCRADESKGDCIPVDSHEFFKLISEGDILVTDDGRGILHVIEVEDGRVKARAMNNLVISSRKSIVIRGKDIGSENYAEVNKETILTALRLGFDFLGLSFVKSAGDIQAVKDFLKQEGVSDIGIIAKIETPSAVVNVNEIISASDAVLVARGDLGMHFSLEKVPQLQSKIVEAASIFGKPVIVATQLLGSMIEEPVPSRSEIVDIMTCVREGVDVLLLTGETAVGKYPVEAVKWLVKTIDTYESESELTRVQLPYNDLSDRFAHGVVTLSEYLDAKVGIFTKTGNMAYRIARYRPRSQILAATNSKNTLKKLILLWGTTPLYVNADDYQDGLQQLERTLIDERYVRPGEILILTYGLIDEPSHIVKILQIQ